MSVPKLVVTFVLLVGLGCTSSYRQETLGVAAVVVGESARAQGVAITSRHEQIEVSYEVRTPRALRLHYKVTCPGEERIGTIGESFEQYSTRRLAELERARQQQVQAKASLVSAVIGSVDGRAQASAGPAQGSVEAGVDGEAVGQALGESTSAQAQLASWDVGAQELRQTIVLAGGEAGRCTMSIWPDDTSQAVAGIEGSFKVIQRIDRARVRREERALADAAAISLRADLHASLVAAGADPKHREKLQRLALRKENEEGARHAVAVVSVSASHSQERALRSHAAMQTRGRLQSWCIGNGADPYYRARQRQANFDRRQAEERARAEAVQVEVARRERERKKFEVQLGFDLRTRTALVATLLGYGADPEYRRKRDEADLRAFEKRAMDVRYAKLGASNAGSADARYEGESRVGTLVVSTQVTRPPVPSAPSIPRPVQPAENATWIAGFYEWRASAWVWVPGLWSVPPAQGAVWVPAVEIELGGNIVLQPGSWRDRSGGRVRRSSARGNPHDHR